MHRQVDDEGSKHWALLLDEKFVLHSMALFQQEHRLTSQTQQQNHQKL
jgi:hypothetical protein